MAFPLTSEPAAMEDHTGLTCPGPILGAREILEGLREGDSVIHHAAAELKGGERVRVKESLVK